MNSTSQTTPAGSFSSHQRVVLWVLWLTYGSFYFCRNNLGVALPGIGKELGLDKNQLGTVLMALKLAYGVGQFINGQLAERLPPRKLLALGLLASAGLNVAFGFGTALYFLIFVWACNGYVQALGWPPTMKVGANWFPPLQRGRAIGIIGTGYQLCGALTFVVAGWAAERFGWRGALYVPAGLLVVSAIHMLVFLKESPEDANLEPSAAHPSPTTPNSFRENLATTLSNPALWFVAVALCLLDACRYGFTDWGVTHLKEVQGASISSSAFKFAVLPFGGIAGAYLSGWATDRYFEGRRVPVIAALLFGLGLLTLAYDTVIHWNLGLGSTLVDLGFTVLHIQWNLAPHVAILFFIGFCIFGPQVLLVGTLPVDLARRGTAAAAAGFVNFMGYMGAAAGDKLTGHIAQDHGWPFAVKFWAACAFAGAVVIACLWKAEGKRDEPAA